MQNQKKHRALKWICWFCTGLIISISISAMWVSGTWNLNRFFDVGEIYDFMEMEYNHLWNENLQFQDGQFVKLSNENASKQIILKKTKCLWKYFYIDINDLNQKNMTWNVSFYRNGEIVQQETVTLKKGGNIFQLAVNNFNSCVIEIPEQQGVQFSISKMQMYEQIPQFNGVMIAVRCVFVMFCYIMITGIFFRLWKRKDRKIDFYKPVETLQRFFMYFSNEILLAYTKKWSLKKRRYIRITLLLFLFIYTGILDMQGQYFSQFPMIVIVASLCVLGLGAACIERETRVLNWKNPLACSWFVLWGIAAVSEFVVEHRFNGMSVSMIFAFGFLYFAMGNMKHPVQLLKDIIQTVKITFWFSTLFCIICRPYIEGTRYMGASYNPAIFAMYEVIAAVTFLGCLEQNIREGSRKRYQWINICGAVLSSFLIWKTQSFTSIAAWGIAILIFLYRIYMNRIKCWKSTLKNIVLTVLLSIILCTGLDVSLKYISYILGTQISFEKDIYVYQNNEGLFGDVMNVKAASANRIIDKIKGMGDLEKASSGRTIFWKDYIRGFNLFGNYGKAVVRSRTENPHNAVIGIGYRYGVLAIIPYCIILLYGLYYLYIERRKKTEEVLPFCYFLTVLMIAMSDNVEQPFFCVPWYILYLMVGYAFCMAEQKEEIVLS